VTGVEPAADVVAGVLAAAGISHVARRAGSLSNSGALAATAVGGGAMAAGWQWGAILAGYFALSVMLSSAGRGTKGARLGTIVEKGGPRDASQVLANGALFTLLALGAAAATSRAGWLAPLLAAGALGALASATADTWATEVGTLSRRPPRSILNGRPVAAGTSGAVSGPGSLALIAGAATVGLAGAALGLATAPLAVTLAGIAGASADSVLGATLQERRWCARCERATEQRVHHCGASTGISGGVPGFDNDAVNFAATVVGAAFAALFLALAHR
jgi:uncharacterized protein (TIGR00297 family)